MKAFLKGKAHEFMALDEKGRLQAHMALLEQLRKIENVCFCAFVFMTVLFVVLY